MIINFSDFGGSGGGGSVVIQGGDYKVVSRSDTLSGATEGKVFYKKAETGTKHYKGIHWFQNREEMGNFPEGQYWSDDILVVKKDGNKVAGMNIDCRYNMSIGINNNGVGSDDGVWYSNGGIIYVKRDFIDAGEETEVIEYTAYVLDFDDEYDVEVYTQTCQDKIMLDYGYENAYYSFDPEWDGNYDEAGAIGVDMPYSKFGYPIAIDKNGAQVSTNLLTEYKFNDMSKPERKELVNMILAGKANPYDILYKCDTEYYHKPFYTYNLKLSETRYFIGFNFLVNGSNLQFHHCYIDTDDYDMHPAVLPTCLVTNNSTGNFNDIMNGYITLKKFNSFNEMREYSRGNGFPDYYSTPTGVYLSGQKIVETSGYTITIEYDDGEGLVNKTYNVCDRINDPYIYGDENAILIDSLGRGNVRLENNQFIREVSSHIPIISRFMFYNSSLEAIDLEYETRAIEQYAFANCTNLSIVNVNGNLHYIEGSAFEGCKILDNLTFTADVDYLDANSLSRGNAEVPCTIAFDGSTKVPQMHPNGAWGDNYDEIAEIRVPSALLNAFKAAEGWSKYADKIV